MKQVKTSQLKATGCVVSFIFIGWLVTQPILEGETLPTAPSAEPEMKLIKLSNAHEPSDWDGREGLWTRTDKLRVPTEKASQVMSQVLPWLRRVLSAEAAPKGTEIDRLDYLRDRQLGDVYIAGYHFDECEVRVIDSSTTVMTIILSKNIKMDKPENVFRNWNTLVRRFMRQPERFDHPLRMTCWQVPHALYIAPRYPEDKLGTGVEFWWYNVYYKLGDGEFQIGVQKLIDGEHSVDRDFGVRDRYGRLVQNRK